MQKCAALVIVLVLSAAGIVAQEGDRPGWMSGPTVGQLGSRATIDVPEGYTFLDAHATRSFLEENQNIPDGDELGTILRVNEDTGDYWFAVFSYSDTGYVDSSDRDSLDADELMKSMREGARHANEERRKRGWATLELEGWHQPPFFDAATRNLTWTTRLSSEGDPIINHSVRLLGRSGLMRAQLVADVGGFDASTQEFDALLRSYSFNPGQRYAEFRTGDKLAGYGLTALIAGGAGAAAAKTGVFKKLWKFLVLGFIALVGAVRKIVGRLGRRNETAEPTSV